MTHAALVIRAMIKPSLLRLKWTNLVFVFELISSDVFSADHVDLSLSSAGNCGRASASLLVVVVDFLVISKVRSVDTPAKVLRFFELFTSIILSFTSEH